MRLQSVRLKEDNNIVIDLSSIAAILKESDKDS